MCWWRRLSARPYEAAARCPVQLREHVHGQGVRVGIQELVKLATGRSLSAAPALRYLEHKYLEDEPR